MAEGRKIIQKPKTKKQELEIRKQEIGSGIKNQELRTTNKEPVSP